MNAHVSPLVLKRSEIVGIRKTVEPGTAGLVDMERRAKKALVWLAPMDAVDWMEQNLFLPPEMTDRPGPMRLNALQKAVVRRLQAEWVDILAFKKPPRFGATLFTAALLLYFAIHEGVDVFYTERNDDYALTFYKKFIFPLLQSPAIAHMKRPDGRNGRQDTWNNTILTNGATIQLRSVATDGFARQSKGKLLIPDESSSPAYMAGKKFSEGNKISLLWRRAQQFFDPKMFVPSTPTEEEFCNVSHLYAVSDQAIYDVPCFACGTMQPFLANFTSEQPGMRFRCDPVTGEFLTYTDRNGNVVPDVGYECMACNGIIRETDKVEMIEQGLLRSQIVDDAGNPAPKQTGVSGIWTWNAYSFDPQASWDKICQRYLTSKVDAQQRQPFKNLDLALVWERKAQRVVPINEIEARAEAYAAPCPAGVRLITWGCDNQRGTDDGTKPARGEIVVVGWGYGEESWVLGHFVVEQIPFSAAWEREVFAIADRKWLKADGTPMVAKAGAVDVGYDMDHGLQFCHTKAARARGIRAIRGGNTRIKAKTINTNDGVSQKNPGWTFQQVNKQSATDFLVDCLRLDVAGPGRVHTPKSLPTEFYQSLTAFEKVEDKEKNVSFWRKDKDNSEVYDCWIYAYARMRAVIQMRKDLRPLIFAPPPRADEEARSLEFQGAPGTAYDGPDRSANSGTAEAIAGAAPKPERAVPPAAPVPPSRPATKASRPGQEFWGEPTPPAGRPAVPQHRSGQPPRTWGKVQSVGRPLWR